MRITSGRLISTILIIATAVYSLSLILDLSRKSSQLMNQWDFAPYYFGAKAFQQGLNPYNIDDISAAAGTHIDFRFVYPPPTLWFFRVFTHFSYPVARQLWLFIKLALLAGLILAWRRYFVPHGPLAFFCLFLLLGFDAAIYFDLKAGNVSIVEQTLIWAAFICLLKRKPLPFCLMILFASIFKITPVFFLLLLPLSDIRNRWKYLAGAAITLIVVVGIWYAAEPALFNNYWASATGMAERADDFNYSSLAFLQDITDSLRTTGLPLPHWSATVAYLGCISLIFLLTAWAFRWTTPFRQFSNPRLLILMSCVVYFLIAPRMKCYSCIIMLIPAYFIVFEQIKARAWPFLFILLILTVHRPLPQHDFIEYFALYYLLYMGVLVWILYLFHIRTAMPVHPNSSGNGFS